MLLVWCDDGGASMYPSNHTQVYKTKKKKKEKGWKEDGEENENEDKSWGFEHWMGFGNFVYLCTF